MSSKPQAFTSTTYPFVPTTTPAIERANHLLGLRAHPGFVDFMDLAQDLVKKTIRDTSDYPGWDPQQIIVLKVRQQVAKELCDALIGKMLEAIQIGLDEQAANTANLPVKTAEEALEQGDYVRQAVLASFKERETENRAAGSYETPTDQSL